MKRLLLILNFLGLICSLIWLYLKPDWEPIVTSIGLVSSLIVFVYQNKSNSEKKISMTQTGDKSNNYQAAGDININVSSTIMEKGINAEDSILWFDLGQDCYILDKFLQINREAITKGTNIFEDRKFIEYETRVKRIAGELQLKPKTDQLESYIDFYGHQAERMNEFFMYLGLQVIKYLFSQQSENIVGKEFAHSIKKDCLKEIHRLLIELHLSDSLKFIESHLKQTGDFNPDELSTMIRGNIRKNYK